MNPNFRNFALWAIIALLLIALFSMFQTSPTQTSGRDIPYSQFLRDVDAGRVRDVTVTGNRVFGTYLERPAAPFQSYAPVIDDMLITKLQAKNVTIVARPESDGCPASSAISAPCCPCSILGVWLISSCARCRAVRVGRWVSASPRPSF